MQVTIVDLDVPYPPNSGKRLRTLNLMLPLAARHDITLIARAADAVEREAAARFLRGHGIRPVLVDEPLASKQGPSFYLRLAANLASPLPYSVTSHISPAMRAAVRRHASEVPIDLMQLEFAGHLYCHEGLTCPLVIQAHNVESLIWKRYKETATDPLRRAYISTQHTKYLSFEKAAFHAADRIVAVSEADAELARKLYDDPPMAVVDNGVDVVGFGELKPDPSSNQVLFLGALDWRPNIDAVEQLLGEIFPALRARVPAATLAIVGRKPAAELRRRIEAVEGATLFADVPDVRPFLTGSAVMAVPLRIGGGSRLKILESLAAGLPVVSTAIGAEGLVLQHGRDLSIADTRADFAAALATALTDRGAALAQAAAGRRTVAARYDWSRLADRLEQIWLEAASARKRLASA